MGTQVTDMPGRSVLVAASWPEAAVRAARQPRTVELGSAPFGYGLEVDSAAVTVVHLAAEPWPQVIWRRNRRTGAEEPVGRLARAACGRFLGRATGSPRRDMLEGLCSECAQGAGLQPG